MTAVCLRSCLCVPRRIPTLLHEPGCNFEEMVGGAPSYALLGGFAIDARVFFAMATYAFNAKCQRER